MRQDVTTGQNPGGKHWLITISLSHGGFRRELSRDTVPRTSIYNFEPSKMEVNDVENLHAALCHPLAQLTACTSLGARKLVKYGETYLFDIKAPAS